jgi:hypothetical protein
MPPEDQQIVEEVARADETVQQIAARHRVSVWTVYHIVRRTVL